MNKIAVTCEEPSLDSQVDPRFGRAAGFLVVDPESMEFEYIDNGSSQVMAQGAGIQAAENVAKTGAKTLLTGYVGPKAFKGLAAAGIKAYRRHGHEISLHSRLIGIEQGTEALSTYPLQHLKFKRRCRRFFLVTF